MNQNRVRRQQLHDFFCDIKNRQPVNREIIVARFLYFQFTYPEQIFVQGARETGSGCKEARLPSSVDPAEITELGGPGTRYLSRRSWRFLAPLPPPPPSATRLLANSRHAAGRDYKRTGRGNLSPRCSASWVHQQLASAKGNARSEYSMGDDHPRCFNIYTATNERETNSPPPPPPPRPDSRMSLMNRLVKRRFDRDILFRAGESAASTLHCSSCSPWPG